MQFIWFLIENQSNLTLLMMGVCPLLHYQIKASPRIMYMTLTFMHLTRYVVCWLRVTQKYRVTASA